MTGRTRFLLEPHVAPGAAGTAIGDRGHGGRESIGLVPRSATSPAPSRRLLAREQRDQGRAQSDELSPTSSVRGVLSLAAESRGLARVVEGRVACPLSRVGLTVPWCLARCVNRRRSPTRTGIGSTNFLVNGKPMYLSRSCPRYRFHAKAAVSWVSPWMWSARHPTGIPHGCCCGLSAPLVPRSQARAARGRAWRRAAARRS
jgi:hypothetical protein